MILTTKLAFDIFSWGVDWGQLKMEEERDKEDLLNAFNGYLADRRTSMPANDIQRRLPHSEKWRGAKKNSFKSFKKLLFKITEEQ